MSRIEVNMDDPSHAGEFIREVSLEPFKMTGRRWSSPKRRGPEKISDMDRLIDTAFKFERQLRLKVV